MNNIQLNIIANAQFQQVYAEVAKLKEAMLSLQKASVGGPFTPQVTASIKQAQSAFDSAVLSTRAFTVEHVAMSNSVEKFGKQLKGGQLSLSNYYKIWRDSAKGVSSELDALATSQARLNRSVAIADPLRPGYAKLVTDINGVVTAQEKQIFYQKALNTALQQGSIKLIDFGKNTQWMGRQLTVGLTMPLAMFGAGVSQAFLQVDKELTRMQKVYGTGLVQPTQAALKQIRQDVTALGSELARTLGTSVQETASMAADLAATGLEGAKLLGATREAIRLATLGELDHQQAMQATVSLQNVYKLSTQGLSDAVNFLNAVENQTSTSLQDLVDAIPRVGPIVQQLGGSFKDTAAMMVAMKEAGVPAAQGANAVKSALSSLINPASNAQKAFKAYNIDLAKIAGETGGKPILMLKALADQMKGLDKLAQAQLIEKLFGKYQFARIQALLDNINKAGTQTATVFNLMGASSADLAKLASNELKQQTESASGRFKRMVETLKADFLPIGSMFLNSFSRIGQVVDKIINAVKSIANVLGPTAKLFGNLFGGGLAGLIVIGPLIMMVGLFANLIGNVLRGVNAMRMFKQGMESAASSENKFLAGLHGMRNFYEDLDKSAIAARNQMDLMPEAITSNATAFNILRKSIFDLTEQFTALALAQREAMGMGSVAHPGQMKFPGFASGGWVPGNPSHGDVYPAMLTGKEAVIQYPNSIKHASVINAIMNDSLPGYETGYESSLAKSRIIGESSTVKGWGNATMFLPESYNQALSKGGMDPAKLAKQIASQGSATFASLSVAMAKEMGVKFKEHEPEFKAMSAKFAETASNALMNAVGNVEKVDDAWIAQNIIPKLKETAATLNVAGKDVTVALDSTISNIRTAGVVGMNGGTAGGEGRMPIPGLGSYKSLRSQSQAAALAWSENNMFQKGTRVSGSSLTGFKTQFQVLEQETQAYEQSVMAHLGEGVNMTFAKMKESVQNLGGNVQDFVNRFKLKFDTEFRNAVRTITQSHSPSEIGAEAGRNMGGGLVKGVEDPAIIQQAKAAGAKLAQAEVTGVAQEIPAARAVGTALGAAEVGGAAGAGFGGGSGEFKPGKFGTYATKYSLAAKASKGGMLGKLGLGKLLGEGAGMKFGLASMMAPMVLGMMPNKVGGTDISGAKNILGSVASVTGMASFIPALAPILPEIAIGTALFGGVKWAFQRADVARKKFENGVKETYKNLENDPSKFISKIEQQTQVQDVTADSYKHLSLYGKIYGDTMLKIAQGIATGEVKGKQLSTVLTSIAKNTHQGVIQWNAFRLAVKNAGDTKLDGLATQIEKVFGKTVVATQAMMRLQMIASAGGDSAVSGFLAANGVKGLADSKVMTDFANSQIKSLNSQIAALGKTTNAAGAGNQAKQDALKKEIKAQELIKKNLQDQLAAMQHKADVINKQNDYLNKQTDLTQQIKQAEIGGNYLQAAQLKTVQSQQASQYKQQQAIDAKQGQVDAQQAYVDKLNEQLQALQDIQSKAETIASHTAEIKALKDQISSWKTMIGSFKSQGPLGTTDDPIVVKPSFVSEAERKKVETYLGSGVAAYATDQVTVNDLVKAGAKPTGGDRWNPGTYTGQIFSYKGKKYQVGAQMPYSGNYSISPVQKKWNGGPISGPGSWTSDSIPAMLSHGEFVMNAGSVSRYGLGMMYALNNKTFGTPGSAGLSPAGAGGTQTINFYINGTNDPKAVADMVMQKLKTVNAKINKTNAVIR